MNSLTSVYQDAIKRQQRDQLVLDHLEYVKQICGTMAKRFPDSVDLQNLQSAGVVGLIEAAQSFDPAREIAFKTFSYPRIRGAIIDEIRRNSPLSQKALNTVGRINAAIETLEPPTTPEQIAEASGLTVTEVEDGLAAARIASPQVWESDFQVAGSHELPEAQMAQQEKVGVLADAIEQLPERERMVVQMYYLEELRLKEIGVVLGVSESRVSRILTRAEHRLREIVRRYD